MKRSMAALAALLFSSACAAQWHECQLAGVAVSATQQRAAVFSQWGTTTAPEFPVGVWATMDVTDLVPNDAECIRITGILIITSGTIVRTCDIHVGFRRYGHTHNASQGAQTVLSTMTGVRTNYSRWVALTDVNGRKLFEVQANAINRGNFPDVWFEPSDLYPEHCAFGVVGWIDAYGR